MSLCLSPITLREANAFVAHSDTCEWTDCNNLSAFYYTSVSGRYSLCSAHCPKEFRTDPIQRAARASQEKP